MAYIGKAPTQGVRNRFYYTATSGQTTFSGADDNGLTLAYADARYTDVYLNGVLLVSGTDYTATTGTSITLTTGAATSDNIEILTYEISSLADVVSATSGGTFDGDVTFNGAFTSQGIDDNANATAITIDSDERVLIGTTSAFGVSSKELIQIDHTGGGRVALRRNDSSIGTGNELGGITFYSADGSTPETDGLGAAILATGDANHSTGDFPTRLTFSTTADGASTPTERMRITNVGYVGIGENDPSSPLHVYNGSQNQIALFESGDEYVQVKFTDSTAAFGPYIGAQGDNFRIVTGDGGGSSEALRIDSSQRVLIGSTSSVATDTGLQVNGTDFQGSSISASRFSNNGSPTHIIAHKSRSGTIGGNTIVQNDDNVLRIGGYGADGTDFATPVGIIDFKVDGTPGSNDMPGRIMFSTTADGSNSATERMRIHSSGNVSVGSSSDAGNKLYVNGVLSTGLGGGENDPQEALRLLRSGYSTSYYHSIFVSTGSGLRSQHYIDFMVNDSTGTGQELACRIRGDKAFIVYGTLSKSSGSFRIDHPLESKAQTHELVHSFVEAPQADNIYRGKVDLVAGSATVNIDTVAGMTEGTFVALNREVQCFTSNESGWTAVKGSVSGNTLTITAQDNTCTDTISWLVVGERHDPHMYETDWTDENGKVIVEPLKAN